MFGWMLLLFTVLPAVEIWLFVQIPMDLAAKLAIVLFTGIAGASLARAQGLRVLREIQESLAAGALPTNELVQGGIVLFGGALLLTPGFLTDTIGFLCLLPPTRALIAAGLSRWFKGRMEVNGPGGFTGGGWSFQAGSVRPGPGARPRQEPSKGREIPPAGWAGAPHPGTGRLDLGAHAGRPASAPQTIEAAFSVIDEGLDDTDEP